MTGITPSPETTTPWQGGFSGPPTPPSPPNLVAGAIVVVQAASAEGTGVQITYMDGAFYRSFWTVGSSAVPDLIEMLAPATVRQIRTQLVDQLASSATGLDDVPLKAFVEAADQIPTVQILRALFQRSLREHHRTDNALPVLGRRSKLPERSGRHHSVQRGNRCRDSSLRPPRCPAVPAVTPWPGTPASRRPTVARPSTAARPVRSTRHRSCLATGPYGHPERTPVASRRTE